MGDLFIAPPEDVDVEPEELDGVSFAADDDDGAADPGSFDLAAPSIDPGQLGMILGVAETIVRSTAEAAGAADPDDPTHWLLTDYERDVLARVGASYAERSPALAAAAENSDTIAVLGVSASYLTRTLPRALELRRDHQSTKVRTTPAATEATTDDDHRTRPVHDEGQPDSAGPDPLADALGKLG